MTRRYLRQIARYLTPWLLLSTVVITSVALMGVTSWYHHEGIIATYNVSKSLIETLSYALTLLLSLPSFLSWTVTFGLVSTIVLMQINVWLLICYRHEFAKKTGSKRSSLVGLSGFIAGLFGVGCSACGTTLLVGILGTVGGVPLFTFLPWHGTELLYAGILIMFGTTLFLLKQLCDTRVCTTP